MLNHLGVILYFMLLLFLSVYVWFINREEKKNIILQNNITQAKLFYDEAEENVRNIRKYRHDLGRHIRIIEHLLADNREWESYEEYHILEEYITKMTEDIERSQGYIYCRHELVNAICQIKAEECRIKGIPLIIQADITEEDTIGIDPYHLSGILMNLLDNAMEAQMRRTDPGEKRVFLLLSKEEAGGIGILVRNDVAEDFSPEFTTSKRNKEQHGFGIGIAREFSALYGDGLKIDYDEDGHDLKISCRLYKQA